MNISNEYSDFLVLFYYNYGKKNFHIYLKFNKNISIIKMEAEFEKYFIGKKKSIESQKEKFRSFCEFFLDEIRKYPIPEIIKKSKYETVLVETRNLKHIEFIIRNAIIKLGFGWSHTILCGNNNYINMKKICNSISPNIKIIKINKDDISIDEYSKMLASIKFWNLFEGEKILIHQEDSFIFGGDINKFMKYDYIGAPSFTFNLNNGQTVGNGGFSLRTKKIMIELINKINIKYGKYSLYTYMSVMFPRNLKYLPEDFYFSYYLTKYKIGKIAPS